MAQPNRIVGPTGQPFDDWLARWAEDGRNCSPVPQGDALGWEICAPSGQLARRQEILPPPRGREFAVAPLQGFQRRRVPLPRAAPWAFALRPFRAGDLPPADKSAPSQIVAQFPISTTAGEMCTLVYATRFAVTENRPPNEELA